MLFNARWLSTNRQVSDINVRLRQKLVSDILRKRTEYSRHLPKTFRHIFRSPRTIFVLNCIISVACTLATAEMYRRFTTDFLLQYINELDITDFLPTKEIFFRRIGSVTIRETFIWV